MKKKSLFVMAFMLLSIQTIFGQWTTNGPDLANVNCLYTSDSEVFAGTEKGLYKSIDAGANWTFLSATPALKILKFNGYLFVSNYVGSGFSRSSDGGQNWVSVGYSVFSPGIVSSIIGVGTTLFVTTQTGIYRSIDNGDNWELLVNGLDATYGYFSTTIQYDVNSAKLYAVAADMFYVSSDMGNSWSALSSIYFYSNNLLIDGNTIVSANDGNQISFDGGVTWQDIANVPKGTQVKKVNTDYYISTFNGLYKSSNGGLLWSKVNMPNDARAYYTDITVVGSTILVSNWDGVFKSDLTASTWSKSNNGMSEATTMKILQNNNTLFSLTGTLNKSTDNGLTWTSIFDANSFILSSQQGFNQSSILDFCISGGTLYVCTSGGTVLKSSDEGSSWQNITGINNGLNTGYQFFNIAKVGNDLFVSGLYDLYKSSDGGAVWNPVNSWPSMQVTSIENKNNDLYVASFGNGVYKSTDGGATWALVNNGLTDLYTQDIAIDGNLITVTTGDGVYYSTDNANSWVKLIGSSGNYYKVYAYQGDVYTTSYSGIYKFSTANTGCYQKYNLPGAGIASALLVNNGKIYAGLYNNNVDFRAGVYVADLNSLTPQYYGGTVTSSITGSTSICDNAIKTYSVSPAAGSTFTWSVPATALITSGQGTNSIQVDFTGFQNSGDISVAQTNSIGCPSNPVSLTMSKTNLAVPQISSLLTMVCVNANNTYSVTNTPSSTYSWSVPSGYTIVSGQGTSSIVVTIGTAAGSISVTETTASNCTAISSPFNVTPAIIPTLTSISGSSTFCAGRFGELYTALPAVSGATYVWTASSSLTPISQLLNKAAFQFSPAVASYTLTAQAVNAGCAGNTVTITITRKLNLSAVSGPATVCSYTTNNYSVLTDDPNANYIWTPSSSGFVSAGNGTSQISLNVNAASGTNVLSVSEMDLSGCASNTQQISIAVKANPIPVSISGTANVCPNQTAVQYTAINATAAFTCNWTVPAGATIVSGQGTNTISVNYTNFNTVGTISVSVVQPLACKASSAVLNVDGTQSTTATITGAPKVCANAQLVPYSVPYHVGSTYSWTVPANAFIISTGPLGTFIYVSFNNFVSGNITVTETLPGGCSIAPLTMAVSSASVSSNYEIPAINVSCNSGTFDVLVNTNTPISSGVIGFEVGFSYDPRVITPVATGTKYTPGPVLTSVGVGNLTQNIFNSSVNASTSVLIYSAYTNTGTFNGTGNAVALRFNVNSGAHVGDFTPLSIMALIEGLSTGGQNALCPANVGLVSIISQETILHGQVLLNSTTTPLGYDIANTSSYLPTTIAGSLSSNCGSPSVSTLPDLAGKFTYDITNGNYLSINRDINNSTIVTGYLNGNDALRVAQIAVGQVVPTIYDILAADVDLSGVVTANDAQFVVDRAVSGSFTSQNRTTPLDWVFIDNTTLNTPPFKKSLTYPLDDMVGFSPTRLPAYSLCMPVRQVSSNSCTDIPDEIYRGMLLGDIATPKFTNTPGSNLKTSGISAADGYTSFYSKGSLVIDLSKAKMTSQGTYLIPLSQLAGDTAQAFDIDLDYNENEITILNVTNADQSIKYAWNNFNGQELLVSGYSLEAIKAGTVVYYLEVAANSHMSASAWGSTFRAMVNGATVEGVIKTPDTSNSQDALNNISMYPNPASDKIYLSDVPLEFTVEIRNLTGELVYSGQNESEMTVSSLSSGMYILLVKSESGTRRFKFNKVK